MKIFITRDLPLNSVFKNKLVAYGLQVHGESLLKIEQVPFSKEALPKSDWLFFYSKNGVNHFYDQLDRPFLAKVGVMGLGTAEFFQHKTGQSPDFVGTGKPEEVAANFLSEAEGQRVLFVRAEHSEQSVQKWLMGKVEALDLVVYSNTMRTDFDDLDADVLVFTSPLNAKAYFSKYYLNGERVVAIGDSTAKQLLELGVNGFVVAESPDEISLAKAICGLV